MLEKSQGNFQRARDLFIKGVRLVPSTRASPHLYCALALMASERGRVAEARDHFREGTQTEAGAQSAALWQAWAILETKASNHDTARKLFQRGLTACPKNKYTWLAWGVWEHKMGNASRARELVRNNPKEQTLPQDGALARALTLAAAFLVSPFSFFPPHLLCVCSSPKGRD